MLRAMPFGAIFELEHEFSSVNTPEYFGVVRKEIYDRTFLGEIVGEGRYITYGYGWRKDDFFVKKLTEDELKNLIPSRFINALLLSNSLGKCHPKYFPKPVALLYSGKGSDRITGESQGFYVAEYIPGSTLISLINQENQGKKIDKAIELIGLELEHLREHGIYHMDFAPRDIILCNGDLWFPVIVDTENLEIDPRIENPELLQKQREQFRKDYGPFFTEDKVRALEEKLFMN